MNYKNQTDREIIMINFDFYQNENNYIIKISVILQSKSFNKLPSIVLILQTGSSLLEYNNGNARKLNRGINPFYSNVPFL